MHIQFKEIFTFCAQQNSTHYQKKQPGFWLADPNTICIFVILIFGFIPIPAALAAQNTDMDIYSNIRYVESEGVDANLQSLDIYTPKQAGRYPVVVMIHGGGWRTGDKGKANMTKFKAPYFVNHGFIYVSINYRLSPQVKHPSHVQDVAKALAWIHNHIGDYRGDPDRIFVMGHSAGAHLAALVSTDASRLASEGKDLSIIKGTICVDTEAYDIHKYLTQLKPSANMRKILENAFGQSEQDWLDSSPQNHIRKGINIPPMLIFYTSLNAKRQQISSEFAAALQQAGVPAQIITAHDRDHAGINLGIGQTGDAYTALIKDFLSAPQAVATLSKETADVKTDTPVKVEQPTAKQSNPFTRLDRDGDDKISEREYQRWRRAPVPFEDVDTDADGFISEQEALDNPKLGPRLKRRRAKSVTEPVSAVDAGVYKTGPVRISNSKAFLDFQFSKDYMPGSKDRHGKLMAGTECNYLVVHDGKLYATVSYWHSDRRDSELPGPQILVKKAADQPWEVEYTFGPDFIRAETMKSVRLTSDRYGNRLRKPVDILLVGATRTREPLNIGIWAKNPSTGKWSRSVVSDDVLRADGKRHSGVRTFADHVDASNGVHYVFFAASKGAIFRGAYDASKHAIVWDSKPELHGARKRIHAFSNANGQLYVTVGVDPKNPKPKSGGLYRRIDGEGRWEWIYQWQWSHPDGSSILTDPSSTKIPKPGMRGLTTIADPQGGKLDILLGVREHPGVIERIDPNQNHKVTVELDIKAYFKRQWKDYQIRRASLFAYNDMVPAVHPDSGEHVHLIGGLIGHPDFWDKTTEDGLASWYLVRHADGSYAHGRVFDPAHPLPGGKRIGLRGTRSIVASPFPEHNGRVWYFGGFDATRGKYRNTAWIYKATIAP